MSSSPGLKQRSILSTQYLSSSSPRWVELDAVEAVSAWLKRPRRNLGLFVHLSDAGGRRLNAQDYLRTMNCSVDGESKRLHKCN